MRWDNSHELIVQKKPEFVLIKQKQSKTVPMGISI
jgi:hypothetical protein